MLPPPDPHESLDLGPTTGMEMPAPTAVHLAGPPSEESDRFADRILDLRPGLLVVLAG